MGLLIVGIIILAFGIICIIINEKIGRDNLFLDAGSIFGVAIGVIMTFACAACWISTDVRESGMKIEQVGYYEELKQEIVEIDRTSAITKHQLNAEIREFNKEIRNNTYWNDNFWVGAYYYDFYSELKPLEIIK